MELDSWQEYVKTNKIKPDYETGTAPHFVDCLEADCGEAFDYINEKVDLALDYPEIMTSMRLGNEGHVRHKYNVAYKDALNSYIEYALDVINNLPIEDEQEDCMDVHKRSEELNQ